MRIPPLLLVLLLHFFTACQPADNPAQELTDKAIALHGGEAYDTLGLEFDFRDMHYIVERNQGQFRYERIQKDSTGTEVRDILTNTEAYRTIGGKRQTLPDTTMNKYKNSVNSVAYFLLLPQPLQDKAVHKEYLGETTIKGRPYNKIKVFFDQEGGGKDYSDVFVYWLDKQDASVDYLAYLYHVDESGLRFREAYNPRRVGGVLVQDYINYAPADTALAVTEANLLSLDSLFQAGQLKELSRIENKNFRVR